MSFLAPGFLIAAGVAALVIVGLHLLSTREPKLELLPTTRFLPDLPVRAKATTVRPTDPWLLLLRVLLVLLLGTALARPVFTPARDTIARIVAVDVSRAVGDVAELADSAERYLAGAAAVILFDSAAYEARFGAQATQAASDSLRALADAVGHREANSSQTSQRDSGASAGRGVSPQIEDLAAGGATPWQDRTTSRGSLSASFIAARRAAARIRDRADSLELIVVSPFVAEEYDAATDRLRRLWPGRVKTVALTPALTDQRRDSIRIEWADSVARGGTERSRSTPPPSGGRSGGGRSDGAVQPSTSAADGLEESAAASTHWTAREPPDTVAALRAGEAVLVYPFVRRWDAPRMAESDARVIARWADGEPAGIERSLSGSYSAEISGTGATGCVRSFGFSLPAEGDALLRPEFQRFLASLAAPCGAPRDFTPLPASVMASLAGEGPLAATAAIERRVERATPLTPWLLLAGALLAVLELFVRRGGGRSALTGGSRSARGESTVRAG